MFHLNVGVNSCPLDGVFVPVHDHGPGHHRDVLQDLLLHFRQRRHVSEITYDNLNTINIHLITHNIL